ncbi:GNAT family N-acetyltransferase [Phyllobacterium sp. 628]|uniref:GNAT family N-acetyltransferase n=1 Tax=Phyllobacterium sp. 628 TaxID=2718938 RepID=UPI0016626BC3|nr:GNAT family N-acetyltransferase [Phyllobacterium sp. 628]QND50830.1 GNAT family N-acetyltransferase [Phyllobacterium sp. 628]
MAGKEHIRPMNVEDIPQVGRLFYKIFRKKSVDSPNTFNDYFKELFFSSPLYQPQHGSYVHEADNGRISSAISAIPMQYMVDGTPMTARLLCAFMTDPDVSCRGAFELALTMRPRHQDLCFTDSASPVSANHFTVVGGKLLPLNGLDWCRIFRPARYFSQSAAKKSALFRYIARLLLDRPIDSVMRRTVPALRVPAASGMHDEDMSQELFVSTAPEFLNAYSVHPVWSQPELDWIVRMARLNTGLGSFHIRSVWDQNAELCGCFVYFADPGSIAQVLNIFAAKGKEHAVIGQMMVHLEQTGFAAALGHVQPRQLDALSRHRAMFYKHRAHVCVSARHSTITSAIDRNDIFIGGLAGESWSRLVSDFF